MCLCLLCKTDNNSEININPDTVLQIDIFLYNRQCLNGFTPMTPDAG